MNRQMRRHGGGGGSGGMGGMDALLRQAQEMQAQLLKAQEEFAETTIEASAGGGMVKVALKGSQKVGGFYTCKHRAAAIFKDTFLRCWHRNQVRRPVPLVWV